MKNLVFLLVLFVSVSVFVACGSTWNIEGNSFNYKNVFSF